MKSILRLLPFFCLSVLIACGGGASTSPSNSNQAASPSITAQPSSATVNAGQSVTFTVSATGTPAPSYQWTLGGANIPGATSATYTIASPTIQQSGGDYAAIVGNSAGTVTSAAARLTVNASSDATTMSVVSGTVTANAGSVTLPNVATVDFGTQSGLAGQTVSVAQVVDSDLNSLALDRAPDLDVDLSDVNTLQIGVPTPPSANVSVTIDAATAIGQLGSNQAATLYIFSSSGNAGDGEDTFEALPPTVDTAANTINVSLPGNFFQADGFGSYVADLKIGVATAAISPGPSYASVVQNVIRGGTRAVPRTVSSPGVSLPCPTGASCTERSRFNPSRYLNGVARPHYGIDLVASSGTAVSVPAGGSPSAGFTQTDYNACLAGTGPCHIAHVKGNGITGNGSPANCTAAPKSCALINGRAGITLTVKYSAFRLRLLHLASCSSGQQNGCGIDPSLLDPSGSVNTAAITSSTPVAYSGNTGAALTGGAHLHFEVVTAIVPVCHKGGSTCSYVMVRTDPFPLIASQLSLSEASGMTALVSGSTYDFNVVATDSNGVPVSSSVQNAAENGGKAPRGAQTAGFVYDPTRKLCFVSSAANTLQFPSADNSSTFDGIAFSGSAAPSYCAPWGTQVTATALPGGAATTIVTLKYSADATQDVASDPLSNASATLALGQPVTYTFTGAPFDVFTGTNCPPVCSLSGTLTLAQALPPNLQSGENGTMVAANPAVSVVSFSFTDGFTTLTQITAPWYGFAFDTDANGNVTYFTFYINSQNSSFAANFDPSLISNGEGTDTLTPSYHAQTSNGSAGTWSPPSP